MAKPAPGETLHRSATFDRASLNEDTRTVQVAFSSETPVSRTFGLEILDHTPGAARLDRLNGGAALLVDHDPGDVIGIVESASIDHDKKGRASVRFGKSARAQEIYQDVIGGIRKHISVGYKIHEAQQLDREDDSEPRFLITDWQPFELSLVALPADSSVGVGRNLPLQESTMPTLESTEKLTRSDRRVASVERERIQDLIAIGEEYDASDLARAVIAKGGSNQDLQKAILQRMGEKDVSVAPVDFAYTGGQRNGMEGYSLQRALQALSDPKMMAQAGYELEMSQELQRSTGKRTSGMLVPLEALNYRAVTKSGTSSATIQADVMAGSFIDVLRARSQVMSLNPTILLGLEGDLAIPRKTAGATAYWIGGDDADSVTASDLTLDQVDMAPKTIGGAVIFSHKMLIQSSPDIEALIRQDLAEMLAVELDKKALQGDGTGSTPTGIISQTGVGTTTYANAGAPDFADVVGLETTLAAANADFGNLAYLTTPAIAGGLKTTDVGTDTGQFVWSAGKERGAGVLNGLPSRVSANCPAGYIIAGNWQDLLIGWWGALEISSDPYGTNFLKGSVTVRVLADVDIAVRHGASFAEIHEAAP